VAVKRKAKTVAELLQVANAKECDRQLKRLMKAGGIKAGDYKNLARQLAIEHKYIRPAPLKLAHDTWGGVIQKKTKGRRTDWTPEKLDELVADVDRDKKEHGFATDDEALRHLAQSGKWPRPLKQDDLNKWIKRLKNELGKHRKVQRISNDLMTLVDKIRSSNPEN
jgi:hypothetical protein